MKTTKQAKDCFINSSIGNESELLSTFDVNSKITIADIGACDGLSTIHYSKMFSNAIFLCFEMIYENYLEMIKNFMEYGIDKRANCYHVALSDTFEDRKVFVSYGQAPTVKTWNTGNKSSSLLKPKEHLLEHPWCNFSEKTIKTSLLDYFWLPIDFMHIDVQGAEKMVLNGASEKLKTTTAIWIEVSEKELYENQAMTNDIKDILLQKGFELIKNTCSTGGVGDQFWRKI